MAKFHDDELERLLHDALHKKLESYPVQGQERVWQKLENSLAKPSQISSYKYRFLSKSVIVAAGILFFCIVSIFFYRPVRVTAIGKSISGRIERIIGSGWVSDIQYNISQDSKTNPPPQENTVQQSETITSLQEIKATCPFPLILPQKLPQDYIFKEGKVALSDKEALITLEYTNRQSDDRLMIREMGVALDTSSGITYSQDGTTVKKISINDHEVTLLIFKNGQVKASWVDEGVTVEVSAKMPEDEILDVIKSFSR